MKVLILDVGSYSIKALYFEKGFRGYNLNHFSHTIISRDPKLSSLEHITESVRLLKKTNNYKPDQTIVIYPADKTTSRTLILPFRDKKRIEMTLPLELEEQLPFAIEDIVYDWETIENLPRGSRVLVTATIKADLDLFIDALRAADADPDIIIPGSDALFSLLNYLKLGKESVQVEKGGKTTTEMQYHPVVIVDIGNTKSNVVISKRGIPEYTRLVNYGGEHVTKRIMEEYGVSYEDAEKSKIEVGYIILDGDTAQYTEEQINFSNILKDAYDVIIRDINQAIASYKAEKKESITTCYIAGSGWQTRNFKEYMAQELRLNIEPLRYHKTLGIKFPFAGTNDELVFINVVGSLLRYIGKSSLKGLNLRKSPKTSIAETPDSPGLRTLLKPTLRNIVVAAITVVIFIIAYNSVLNRSLAKYNTELENKVKIAFPDKDKKARDTLIENYSKLSSEIQARMKATRTLIEGEAPKKDSALDILMNLSYDIPKDVVVDVLELNIDPKGVKIVKAIVPNAENAQQISSLLEKSPDFKDVKQGTIKIAPDGAGKEFEISMTHKVMD
ncbi:MAG: pilus assembly protein PilM [bacterium]